MIRYSRNFYLRKAVLMLIDIFLANIALLSALLLSHNFNITEIPVHTAFFLPVSLVCIPAAVILLGAYRIVWRVAGFREVVRISVTIFCGVLASLLVVTLIFRGEMLFSFIEAACAVLAAVGMSVVFRMVIRHLNKRSHKAEQKEALRESGEITDYGNTMVVGAGSAAEMLLREIFADAKFSLCTPVAVIDDNPDIHGNLIRGVPIVGGRENIVEVAKAKGVKTIFFAIPSASKEQRREILKLCSQTGCDVRTMPGLDESLDNGDLVSKIRKVNISDLLGREMIKIDVNKILGYVENKTVMVTGGGGSIGSELCRQIAGHNPKQLIIFDIYENSTYDILNELKRSFPELNVLALIGSVRDEERLNSVFETYRPEIVYHAAAHKHVPLMEDSPHEAVKNNVFGTLNTVRAADKYGTKRFVMISTDKAVNPTNIMGTTKRLCEMIIQTYNKKSNTEYVAVRFGNVLGSNGSVIPLFERQIEAGGPVTVTHPDIIRYFMTIPEAVSLVLTAGASAKGGEIFVLDMGDPVKILDLAENMIRLSGFEPYTDIDIKFTGLRPGEKLFEELLMDEEGLQRTDNSLIYIGQPISLDEDKFFASLEKLWEIASDDSADIRGALHEMVPTFKEPEVH